MNKRSLVLVMSTVPLFLAAHGGDGHDPQKVAATSVSAPAPQDPNKKPQLPPKLDPNLIKAFFSAEPAAPKSDNTLTDEKVALGKMLYHEKVLDGDASCASCHDLAKYGQDGTAISPGAQGKRHTLSTWNAARQFVQSWDGRATSVEDAVSMPGHSFGDEAAVLGKIKAKPELAAAFAKAFPGGGDAVTFDNFKLALGAFQRKLVTRSPFDDFVDGKRRALTTEQQIGLKTFIDVGCTACHTTRLLGGQMYQKIGVTAPYASSNDEGRFKVTKNEAEKGMFKVTSLLNVAQTAPYMHDGAVATLPEVVRLMGKIQLNKALSDDEVSAIVAFLESLTGKLPEDLIVQ